MTIVLLCFTDIFRLEEIVGVFFVGFFFEDDNFLLTLLPLCLDKEIVKKFKKKKRKILYCIQRETK